MPPTSRKRSVVDFDAESIVREAFRTALSITAARLPPDRGLSILTVARRFLKIRAIDPDRISPFILRPIQKRYLARKRLVRMRGRPRRYLLLKYRRGGFTTVEQAESYFVSSRRRNTNVLTLAQTDDSTEKIFRIALLMHERDPEAPAKAPSESMLHFPGLRSFFYIATAGGSGVGRGDTLTRVHWSEVAWSRTGFNQIEKQRALLAGLTEAASHGEVVLETTANGAELFRELYLGAKRGENDWTPIFIPWFDDPLNRDPIVSEEEAIHIVETMSPDEARLVVAHGLDPGQLKWRRRKKRELGPLFAQEYPEDDETCFLTSGIPFFDLGHLLPFLSLAEKTITLPGGGAPIPFGGKPIPGGYYVEWIPPEKGRRYSIGVDSSEGIPGSDPNGLGVMRDDGVQVASAHGLFDTVQLAELTVKAHKRYNRALVGVERENHGHAVIQKVVELGLDRPHYRGGSLFFFDPEEKSKAKRDRSYARAGWSTNGVTRPVMLQRLRDWTHAPGAENRIRDPIYVSECFTFKKQPDGKFSADSGAHDDSVMKWAIANEMRMIPRAEPMIWVAGIAGDDDDDDLDDDVESDEEEGEGDEDSDE
jgi:hypothetical protein